MKNPVRRAFQKFCNEPRVQRVAGAIRNQPAQHRLANEGEVAEQVQSLVPNKFVRKAERRIVQDAVFGKNDRVFQRAAADQKLADLLAKKTGMHFLQIVKDLMPEPALAEAPSAG